MLQYETVNIQQRSQDNVVSSVIVKYEQKFSGGFKQYLKYVGRQLVLGISTSMETAFECY